MPERDNATDCDQCGYHYWPDTDPCPNCRLRELEAELSRYRAATLTGPDAIRFEFIGLILKDNARLRAQRREHLTVGLRRGFMAASAIVRGENPEQEEALLDTLEAELDAE